ncbi:RING-H2 finger protein ATL80-like [Zingiber officinale]|uniref:RING-H2 finger protein ATL80-like n=1 Tax=Zingiber officinale TaxID=94328 RepID=UPI001C4CABDF|nr:RING-H2 finger protein ATL80-like [Zingiber officinale]
MCSPARLFLSSEAKAPSPLPFDSDITIILVVLLCAIVCVVSLVLITRCIWLHHAAASSTLIKEALAPIPAPPNKSLKKKAVRILPTLSFNYSTSSIADGIVLLEGTICLAEFADGEVLRSCHSAATASITSASTPGCIPTPAPPAA